MKELKPLVSIGMPVYNAEKYIVEAIESLLNQTYERLELIISDNNSSDTTLDICKMYAEQDSRVYLHSNSHNIGAGKNFEKVLTIAKGKYFMWASHDDRWDVAFLEKCVSSLEEDPQAVLASPGVIFIDEDGNQIEDSTNYMKIRDSGLDKIGIIPESDLEERIFELVRSFCIYNKIYGLYKTEFIRLNVDLINILRNETLWGGDVLFYVELLLQGGGVVKIHDSLFFYRLKKRSPLRYIPHELSENITINLKPHSWLIQKIWHRILLSSLDYEIKHRIKEGIVYILMLHNPVWLNIISQEQNFNLEKLSNIVTARAFINSILDGYISLMPNFWDQKTRVFYEVSVLGLAYSKLHARTGVHRVVENIAYGLSKSSEVDLSFFSFDKNLYFEDDLSFVEINPKLIRIPFYDIYELDTISKDCLVHSPYFHFPKKMSSTLQFLTIYDLIPILYPQFFEDSSSEIFQQKLDRLSTNDWIITISESTRNDLCNRSNVDPMKIFVTHLAADSRQFYPCIDTERIIHTRRKYNIQNTPYILSLCTLEPRKNIHHIIRCFSILVQDNKLDINLVLAGTPGWKFKEIVSELEKIPQLRNRIHFTGYVANEDLAPLYSGALAFVYPSFYEGFGLPALEAMQCGTPVITSNTSSLPEVVGNAGIMVDPSSVDELCHHLHTLYHSPGLQRSLSIRGIYQARDFSWDKCISQTIQAYQFAIQGIPNSNHCSNDPLSEITLRSINILVCPNWSLAFGAIQTELCQLFRKLIFNRYVERFVLLIHPGYLLKSSDIEHIVSEVLLILANENEDILSLDIESLFKVLPPHSLNNWIQFSSSVNFITHLYCNDHDLIRALSCDNLPIWDG